MFASNWLHCLFSHPCLPMEVTRGVKTMTLCDNILIPDGLYAEGDVFGMGLHAHGRHP